MARVVRCGSEFCHASATRVRGLSAANYYQAHDKYSFFTDRGVTVLAGSWRFNYDKIPILNAIID